LAPPAEPSTNSGATAEALVAKLLRAEGWTVVFYTHRRGFGFDLWARKRHVAILIEVKSSLHEVDAACLTEAEYEMAKEYGRNYVLAIVEAAESNTPRVSFISGPATALRFEKRTATVFAARRSSWLKVAEASLMK
jgi:hypothetical protein